MTMIMRVFKVTGQAYNTWIVGKKRVDTFLTMIINKFG